MSSENGIVARIKTSKDVLAAALLVITVLSGVVKFSFDEAMESRDSADAATARVIAALAESHSSEMEAALDHIGKLEEAQSATVDASRDRFQRSEVIDAEIRGAVNALRTEIRVRHRENPEAYGVSRGTSRLRHLSRETDRMLIRSQNAMPQDDPLEGL